MKILDRYLMNSVIGLTAMVFIGMAGLSVFISLFAEIPQLGQGDYGLLQALQFAVMTLPANIYQLFPNIALLGALMSLGLLAQNSELTVMRASGMSIGRIIWAVTKAAILMVMIMAILGEVFAPRLFSIGTHHKNMQKAAGQAIETQYGTWLREENSFIHIDKIVAGTELYGVTRYYFNAEHQLISASYAESAKYIDNGWYFYNIHTSYFKKDAVLLSESNNELWNIALAPHTLGDQQPMELSLWELYEQINYRHANGLAESDYSLAFWTRLLQPLTTLIMVLLAIPFVFGPLRTVTMGLRILAGVMVGLVFYLFNRFFGPFSLAYQLPPYIAAIIPPIIFSFFAIFLAWRKR